MVLCRRDAVEAVPPAGRVVAALVAPAVAEVVGAEAVEVFVALTRGRVVAVVAVEEAFLLVAVRVALAVPEHVPAVLPAAGGVAELPRTEKDGQ